MSFESSKIQSCSKSKTFVIRKKKRVESINGFIQRAVFNVAVVTD